MNNVVFGKTMDNVRKHRDIKLVTTEGRRNYLVSEPNYHTTKFFVENQLAIGKEKKTQTLMNKPIYTGPSMLELSKIVMHEFRYDYAKPKCDGKAKLCYMDTDLGCIKTDDIYKDIAEDIETRFNNSNYELDRPLPKGKK